MDRKCCGSSSWAGMGAILLMGCGAAASNASLAPEPIAPEPIPECAASSPPPAGSILPPAVAACRYEQLMEEAIATIEGPASVSTGGVALWAEPALDGLAVGVVLAGIPNLDVGGLTAFGVTLHIERVASSTGTELLDASSPFADPAFDALLLQDVDGLVGPFEPHRMRVFVPTADDVPPRAVGAQRTIGLVPGATTDGEAVTVTGELVLRLPVDVTTVEVERDAAPIVAEGVTLSLHRDETTGAAQLRLEDEGHRYAGHEPVGERGLERQERCSGTPSGSTTRVLSCEYEVPVDRIRVAIAHETHERRIPFVLNVVMR